MEKTILSVAERKAILQKVPVKVSEFYDLIEQNLASKGIDIDRQLIGKAFREDKRYRVDVFDAAIEEAKKLLKRVENQREAIPGL